MDKMIERLQGLKQKMSESPRYYLDILSAIDKDEPIKGLTDEEINILRKIYNTTKNDGQNS